MTVLFRDSEDNALSILSVEFAGYDVNESEVWVVSSSGVYVSFRSVPSSLANVWLRNLSNGFLDVSGSSFLGEVEYD